MIAIISVLLAGQQARPRPNPSQSPAPPIRVLVCAQSNAAIDQLIMRLADPGILDQLGSRRYVSHTNVCQSKKGLWLLMGGNVDVSIHLSAKGLEQAGPRGKVLQKQTKPFSLADITCGVRSNRQSKSRCIWKSRWALVWKKCKPCLL